MKNRLIYLLCLLFTTGMAFAQPKNDTNDTGGSPLGISTTTLIIGLVILVVVGYLLYSRSKKS